jgi:formate dehydrogenase iron-sulfur subunit
VLSRIPDIIPLGGVLLGGVWWITHRREEVAAAESPKKKAEARTPKGKFNEN